MEDEKSNVEPKPTSNKAQKVSQQNATGLAIASLVIGIVSLTVGWIAFAGLVFGIAAIVLGAISIKKLTNKGMAIAGIITGSVAVLWNLIMTALFIISMLAIGGLAIGAGTIATEINKVTDNYNNEQQTLIDAKKDFSKGSTAKFGDFEVKVNKVTRNYSLEDSYYSVDEGKELIVVNVSVKNVGDEQANFSSYDLKINDNGISDGSSYLATVSPEFEGGDMSPGATATGNIVYEVNSGSNNLKLQYEKYAYDTGSYEAKTLVYTLAL